ncbi:hypothetical protein J2S19_000439 [Metabacillus malikii]|uniref:Uncharacterized protein n=1 Tax=Metabacillus malikii TaxID=1504265 RepID=A0ABT9ZBA3_9BACI|nr:hypothetical protein [Metabacillus malikii]
MKSRDLKFGSLYPTKLDRFITAMWKTIIAKGDHPLTITK